MAITATSLSTERRNVEQILMDSIDRCTARRLRRLRVTRVGNQLTIRAEAPSFYVKQLALTSVLKTIGAKELAQIVYDIRVTKMTMPGLGSSLEE